RPILVFWIDCENLRYQFPVPDALAGQCARGTNSSDSVDLISEVAVTLSDAFMPAVGNRNSLTAATTIGFGEFAFEENQTIGARGDGVNLCGTRFSKQFAW